MPPHIPSRSLCSRAQPRQSSRTGHSAQIATASVPPASIGYQISGFWPRHSARRRHRCDSQTTPRLAGASSATKAALFITPSIPGRRGLGRQTMVFPFWRKHRPRMLLHRAPIARVDDRQNELAATSSSAVRTAPGRSSHGKCPQLSRTRVVAPRIRAADASPCRGGIGLSAPRTKMVGLRN